jgi:hypothetical protein
MLKFFFLSRLQILGFDKKLAGGGGGGGKGEGEGCLIGVFLTKFLKIFC